MLCCVGCCGWRVGLLWCVILLVIELLVFGFTVLMLNFDGLLFVFVFGVVVFVFCCKCLGKLWIDFDIEFIEIVILLD